MGPVLFVPFSSSTIKQMTNIIKSANVYTRCLKITEIQHLLFCNKCELVKCESVKCDLVLVFLTSRDTYS